MLVQIRRFGLFLLALMLGSTTALATDWPVAVGNGGLTFTPNTLNSVHVGDTVTFTYAGGTGSHNVATYGASAQSFRCATDCAANGGASTNPWTQTITIGQAGTITYHCETHGLVTGTGSAATCSGMCGTISVTTPVELQSFDVGNR